MSSLRLALKQSLAEAAGQPGFSTKTSSKQDKRRLRKKDKHIATDSPTRNHPDGEIFVKQKKRKSKHPITSTTPESTAGHTHSTATGGGEGPYFSETSSFPATASTSVQDNNNNINKKKRKKDKMTRRMRIDTTTTTATTDEEEQSPSQQKSELSPMKKRKKSCTSVEYLFPQESYLVASSSLASSSSSSSSSVSASNTQTSTKKKSISKSRGTQKDSSSSMSSSLDTNDMSNDDEEEEMSDILEPECSTTLDRNLNSHMHHHHHHHHHEDQHQQQHTAAKTIQDQWKKKRTVGSPNEMDGEGDDEHVHKKKYSRKPVPAPSQEVRSWIQHMEKTKQRQDIFPGMRVKVRFQVDVKSQHSTSTKLSWFGGCVVAVAEEGKMITIQYDDGTSELNDFPDKDIIVDDEGNGRHLTNAQAFIPPLNNQENPTSSTSSSPSQDIVAHDVQNPMDIVHKISHIQPVVVVQSKDTDLSQTNSDRKESSIQIIQVDHSHLGKREDRPSLTATKPVETSTMSCPTTPKKVVVDDSNAHMSSSHGIIYNDHTTSGFLTGTNEIVTGSEKDSLPIPSSPKLNLIASPSMTTSSHVYAQGVHDELKSSNMEHSVTTTNQLFDKVVSASPTNEIINMDNKMMEDEPRTPQKDLVKSPRDDAPSTAVVIESSRTASDDAEMCVPMVPPLRESTTVTIAQKDRTDASTNHDVDKVSTKKTSKDKVNKKRKQSSRSDDNGSKEPEIEDLWVACDRCKKWRKLPGFMMQTLPELWYCEYNVHDPKRNNCDASEEPYETKKTKKKSTLKISLNRDVSMTSERPSTSSFDDEKVSMSSNTNTIPVRTTSTSVNGSTSFEEELNPPKSSRPMNTPSNSLYLNKTISNASMDTVPNRSVGSVDGAASESGESTTPLSPKAKPGRKPNSTSSSVVPATAQRLVKEEDKKIARVAGALVGTGSVTAGGKGKTKETPTQKQEWVQCEICEKWRRLPQTVSASDLPEYWICTMNTWDPRSASCAVQEDYKREDEEHVNAKGNNRENTILGHSTGTERIGKLSYRTLLAGNGKRPMRPMSEKTRYAESIFLPPSFNANSDVPPPRPMYADSSVYRSAHAHSSEDQPGPSMDLFTMLSHSKLWSILSNGSGDVKEEVKESEALPTAPMEDSEMTTSHYSIDEKPGGENETVPMESMIPTDATTSSDTKTCIHAPEIDTIETRHVPSSSRCMKISKPWKYLAEPMT